MKDTNSRLVSTINKKLFIILMGRRFSNALKNKGLVVCETLLIDTVVFSSLFGKICVCSKSQQDWYNLTWSFSQLVKSSMSVLLVTLLPAGTYLDSMPVVSFALKVQFIMVSIILATFPWQEISVALCLCSGGTIPVTARTKRKQRHYIHIKIILQLSILV